jgi:hypothetical protein
MKYLVIHELIVPFQLQLKFLIHVISQKTFGHVFHSNEHKYVEKTFCWKIIFIWKITRIMLEAFVSNFILYVYQNAKWNQRKIAPQIIQNIPQIYFICLAQSGLLVLCFHHVLKLLLSYKTKIRPMIMDDIFYLLHVLMMIIQFPTIKSLL